MHNYSSTQSSSQCYCRGGILYSSTQSSSQYYCLRTTVRAALSTTVEEEARAKKAEMQNKNYSSTQSSSQVLL